MILNEHQIDTIAEKLNEKINLPLLGEKAEKAILLMGIRKVLEVMEENMPPEFSQFLTNAAEGFEPSSEASLKEAKANIVTFVNKKVNLPIIGERAEKQLFQAVVDLLFDAMKKDNSLAA